jgi:hypothetical protein
MRSLLTARSFDSPDFVEIVMHSYQHRYGAAVGEPSLEAIEQQLAARPRIKVPTIVLHDRGSSGIGQPYPCLNTYHRLIRGSQPGTAINQA